MVVFTIAVEAERRGSSVISRPFVVGRFLGFKAAVENPGRVSRMLLAGTMYRQYFLSGEFYR